MAGGVSDPQGGWLLTRHHRSEGGVEGGAVILNQRFTTYSSFRDVLCGFRAGRGTGTTYLKAKMLQQLMAMMEEILYAIFLDL